MTGFLTPSQPVTVISAGGWGGGEEKVKSIYVYRQQEGDFVQLHLPAALYPNVLFAFYN